MAAPRRHSKSAVASNNAVSLLQHSLGFSFACCYKMHSTQQQKESTFIPDQMAGSSTLPVSEPRQRYARFSSWTCRLLINDAAVVTHTQEEFQSLMDCFSQACKDFELTISLKKTNVLGQDTEAPPAITIDNYELDAVCQFTYLGSTITDNLSLDTGID